MCGVQTAPIGHNDKIKNGNMPTSTTRSIIVVPCNDGYELIDGHWSQVNHSVLLTENIEVYTMWLIDMLNTGQIKPDQLADVELSAVENSLKKNK